MSQSLQLSLGCGASDHVETFAFVPALIINYFSGVFNQIITVFKTECDNFGTNPAVVSKFQLQVELIELSVAEVKVCSVHLKLEFVVM